MRLISPVCTNRILLLIITSLVVAYFVVLCKDSQSFIEAVSDKKRTTTTATNDTTTTAAPTTIEETVNPVTKRWLMRRKEIETYCHENVDPQLLQQELFVSSSNETSSANKNDTLCQIPGVGQNRKANHPPSLTVTVRHPFSRLAEAYFEYVAKSNLADEALRFVFALMGQTTSLGVY
jgi:hypothetical protein